MLEGKSLGTYDGISLGIMLGKLEGLSNGTSLGTYDGVSLG